MKSQFTRKQKWDMLNKVQVHKYLPLRKLLRLSFWEWFKPWKAEEFYSNLHRGTSASWAYWYAEKKRK